MLKFILIVTLIFIFFRVFGKYILAGLIMLVVPRIMKKAATQQQQQYRRQEEIRPEGSIKVEKNNNDKGDYVDYEVVE